MSAVAAVVRWDAGPVEPTTIRQMTPAGPIDVAGTWVNGQVAVGEFRLESVDAGPDPVPLVGADGVVLAWDGRLDNRAELLARFDTGRLDTDRFGSLPNGRPPSDA